MTTKAIVVVENGVAAIRDIPIPKVRDEWVLVKVNAIGLNPTDWKHIDFGNADVGSRSGCDYAGVVEEVGSKVTNFKKGDRIAGYIHGGDSTDHESGAFGGYAIAKAGVQIKVPDNISDVEAATLGISTATVGQGLYKSLKLPQPNSPAKEPFPLLIYGGSTATGIAGIQYAKASGLTVIATASPRNFEYLKSIGADAVFDYNSPTCAADIKAFTNNKLRYAWDCIGTGAEISAAAMSDAEQGFYGTIIPVDKELLKKANPNVEGPFHTLGYDIFGQDYFYNGKPVKGKPDEFEFAAAWHKQAEKLLANGTVKPIKTTVNSTGEGLEGAFKGLDELRNNRVSGTKLVYTL